MPVDPMELRGIMLGSWQDVLVTLIAAGAVGVVVRPLIPTRWRRRAESASACSRCAAGNACAASPPVSVASAPVIRIQRQSPPK